MSASRRLCLSRKRDRKLCSEGTSDNCDDFQEPTTVFRLPKRQRTGKSQGKSKSSVLNPGAQEGPVSATEKEPFDEDITVISQKDQHIEILGNDTSEGSSDLHEIEKLLCTESEKLCPSCKVIVPSDLFSDHFKDCLQKFKLITRGEKKIPVTDREEETSQQEEQELVLPCPVCKKPFKSKTQRVSHIKSCGQGYGLTSEQVLLASRLLEKQREEWNELGLPSALQLPTTRPKARTAKPTRDLNDPDIAMALALSRSIAEEEVESRTAREEKLFALGMEDIVDEDRKVKPVLLPLSGPANRRRRGAKNRKGCHHLQKTPLATRSVEERERLISEKVAVLLTSADTSKVGWTNSGTPKQSRALACLVNKPCQLWEAARSGTDEPLHSFYVPELEPYINPKETVIGGLFKQLSQVPGRLNTTALHTLDEESDSECEMEETSEVEEFCTQMALAELMGSQEEWNTTSEIEWEDETEGMKNHGFLLPSQIAKSQEESKVNTSIHETYSDSQICELNRNSSVDTEEAFKENPDNQTQLRDCDKNSIELQQNSDSKNKNGISQFNDENITTTPSKENGNLNHNMDPCVIDHKCANECGSSDSKSETVNVSQENKKEDSSVEGAALQNTPILYHTSKHAATISESENRQYNTLVMPSKEVVSTQSHFSESCYLSSKVCHAENTCFESPIDSKEVQQSQKHWQSIDIASNLAKCNDTSTPYFSTDNYAGSKDDINEEHFKEGSLHFSQYNKNIPPIKTVDRDYEKTSLEVSLMGSYECHRNVIVNQSDGKNAKNYSETSKISEHEIFACTLKEKTLSKRNFPNTKSDLMVETLIKNWRDMMESGTESDVTIVASDGSSMAAHSLVLLARCPQLYEESKVHDNLIKWDNIPQKTAHHFLSYLYSGTCEVTTPDDPLWIELYDIALRYKCNDLISYMELLYKDECTPVKNPTINMKICIEPRKSLVTLNSAVSSALEVDKHSTLSEKTPVFDLEDNLELRNSPANFISDSTNKSMTDGRKVLKPTRLFSGKAHEELGVRNSPENKVPKVDLFTTSGQDKSEHVQRDEGTQSPDFFDESCFRSCITSTTLNLPPLTAIPLVVKSVPKEVGKVSPKAHMTSSPCKMALFDEEKDDKKIMCNVPSPLILPINSEIDTGENEGNIPSAILSPPVPSQSERCELSDNNDDSDHSVIDLSQQSGSEASITDLHNIDDCQTDTKYKDPVERLDFIDNENEKPLICEPVDTHEHYISNIWDDFDTGDSHMTVSEEICSTSFKRPISSVCEKINSNNEFGSCVTPVTHTSNHHVASIPLLCGQDIPQREICSGTLQSTKLKEKEYLKLDTKCTPSVNEFAEFTEGHPSDETLVNIAAEIEQWDVDLHQTGNQIQPKSVTATSALCSTPATSRQMCVSKRKLVTPQPDYKTMKSPELKKELQKYGICALGRKKAVLVLQHVYEQTHPLITDSEAETSFSQTPQRNAIIAADGPKPPKPQVGKKRRYGPASDEQRAKKKMPTEKVALQKSVAAEKEGESEVEENGEDILNSSLSSTSSEGSSGYLFGDIVFPSEEEDSISSTQQADLASQVRKIIISNTDLHRKVLLYEPIFVEDLHAILKSNKTKCSMQALLDVLDDLCLIVRTQANQNRNQTRASKKRRKNSPRKKSGEAKSKPSPRKHS